MTMPTEPAQTDRIAELLLHIGRSARHEGAGSALTSAQWTCLRFFARANRSSCTPSAFASFQATTRGTASQIIKGLEGRGLILRRRDGSDGRSVRFELTAGGRAVLAGDPLQELAGAIAGFGAEERAALQGMLSRLAERLAEGRGAPAFGSCEDCIHFSDGPDGGRYCACMAATLEPEDLGQLCAHFSSGVGDDAESQTEEQSQ